MSLPRGATSAAAGPARQWAVRFLSGPLRGRTQTLKPGACVLGAAADCDILLPSTEALPRHLVFTAGDLALVLQKLEGAQLMLNGEAMQASRRSLVAGDVVSVGKTDFQIDHVYARRDAQEPPEHADSMFLADDAEGLSARAANARPRRGPLLWMLLAASVLGAGAVLLVGWGRGAADSSPSSPLSARLGVDFVRLEKTLRDYPDVEMAAAPGGRFSLKGYVETGARLNALRAAVRQVAPQAVVQVQVAEDMVDQAIRFIADPAVSVMYAGKGRLLATGSVEGGAARERIKQLNSDWQPAAFIEDKLSQREAQAQAQPPTDAQNVAFWQSQLPSRLVSVTEGEGGLRHVQLANGHRYFEGSQLKSGAEIKRIDADALDIRPARGAK
jgi:hypothetical protein